MNWIGETFGYLAGLSTAFCFLPQTIQTVRTRNVQGLSATSYFIYVLGMVFWTTYGIYMNSIPMMVFNGISFVFAITILYTILTQRKRKT